MSIFLIGTSQKTLRTFPCHTHTRYEIVLNMEGDGVNIIGGEEIPFRAGSICIIPPNTSHTKHSDGGFRDIYIQTDTPGVDGAENGLYLEDDKNGSLSALMQMMLCRYVETKREDSTLLLMYDLFVHLLRERCKAPETDPVVAEVRRLLALHFNDPEISLSTLLANTGYDKDYLRRRFLAVCGKTPMEYLTDLRIKQAKRLLKQQGELQLSIADIGAMCGYYDGRYFSRIFKKQTGISPGEYADGCHRKVLNTVSDIMASK